jgi:hypothetical protein
MPPSPINNSPKHGPTATTTTAYESGTAPSPPAIPNLQLQPPSNITITPLPPTMVNSPALTHNHIRLTITSPDPEADEPELTPDTQQQSPQHQSQQQQQPVQLSSPQSPAQQQQLQPTTSNVTVLGTTESLNHAEHHHAAGSRRPFLVRLRTDQYVNPAMAAAREQQHHLHQQQGMSGDVGGDLNHEERKTSDRALAPTLTRSGSKSNPSYSLAIPPNCTLKRIVDEMEYATVIGDIHPCKTRGGEWTANNKLYDVTSTQHGSGMNIYHIS